MTYTEARKRYLAEWHVWYRMCYDCANNTQYYVEVSVCPEWQGPQGFMRWLKHMGPRPSDKHVLDRPNKLGDYTPDNTQWATKQISQSTAKDHWDTDFLKWYRVAIKNGIHPSTYRNRINLYGWTMQDAATLTPEKHKLKKRLT